MKLFPAGSFLVETIGLNRSFFFTGGIKQFFKATLFYATRMKGKSPYYQIHIDKRLLSEMTPAGLNDFFIRIAQMLKRQPEIKGIFGIAWIIDPAMEHVSPRHWYMTELILGGGAKIFRFGSSRLDIENATARSKNRKRLYEEGKYMPTSYIMIWLRKELMEWAKDKQLSK
jgi:hypothetical protein